MDRCLQLRPRSRHPGQGRRLRVGSYTYSAPERVPYGDTAVGGVGGTNRGGSGVFFSVKARFQPFVTFLPPRSAADIRNHIQILLGSDGTEQMILRAALEKIIVRTEAEKKKLEFTICEGGANTQLAAPR